MDLDLELNELIEFSWALLFENIPYSILENEVKKHS